MEFELPLVYILQRALLLLLLCVLLLLFIFATNIHRLTVILLLSHTYKYIFLFIWSVWSYAQTSSRGIPQREPEPTSLPSAESLSSIMQKGTHIGQTGCG